MPSIPYSSLHWAAALATIPAAVYAYRLLTSSRPHFPPGPKGNLFIGNVVELSTDHNEKLLHGWAKEYGKDILTL
jgi:hypothetical protein